MSVKLLFYGSPTNLFIYIIIIFYPKKHNIEVTRKQYIKTERESDIFNGFIYQTKLVGLRKDSKM